MANMAKYTKGAMGHLMKHYERGKDASGEYIKFGNQQIDLSRTHLNYNLAPEHDQLDFIHQRLSEVHTLKRKDVNVMCSWVVTVPKGLPEEYHKEFFERSYDFLRKRYSPDEKNIISAYVHLDEVTPHMHFAFVPVVYDQKKDREKVSAKEVVNRTDLSTFHQDFQNVMDRFVMEHGNVFKCDVLNGATANGNKSIEEYKAEKATARVNNLSQRSVRLKKDISGLQADKTALQDKITTLEGKIDSLDSNSQVLMQKFVEHPKIKPLFSEYCKAERDKVQGRQEHRKSVKANLARYQSEEAKKQTAGTAQERKRPHHKGNER